MSALRGAVLAVETVTRSPLVRPDGNARMAARL